MTVYSNRSKMTQAAKNTTTKCGVLSATNGLFSKLLHRLAEPGANGGISRSRRCSRRGAHYIWPSMRMTRTSWWGTSLILSGQYCILFRDE
jgi:hypothetical protein